MIIKFINRLDKAEIALLNQVKELHPSADITFCNADNKPEVRFRKLLFGLFVAVRHALCNINFLVGGQKRHSADFFKIHAHGVIDCDSFGYGKLGINFRNILAGDFNGVDFFNNIDIRIFKSIIDDFHLINIQCVVAQCVNNLFIGQFTLAFAAFNQLVHFLHGSQLGFICHVF